jgi:virulence-associated protein VapD
VGKVEKTVNRIVQGNSDANLRFKDVCSVLEHFGFSKRVRGDHHIFTHERVTEILNLQPRNGKAKPYQVKQVRNVLIEYGFVNQGGSDDSNVGENLTDEETSEENHE